MGFGHSLPLTVIVLDLLYCSTSCCENRGNMPTVKNPKSLLRLHNFQHVQQQQRGSTFPTLLRNTRPTYHRPPRDVRVLLVEVLLKLGQLVQVPLLLPQSVSRVAELAATAAAAVAPEARRAAAIAAVIIKCGVNYLNSSFTGG